MNIIRAGQKGLYVSGYVWACIVLGLLGFVYRVLRKIKLQRVNKVIRSLSYGRLIELDTGWLMILLYYCGYQVEYSLHSSIFFVLDHEIYNNF